MSKPKSSTISDQVLGQIKEGQVRMHADWYFALLASGFAIAVASVMVVAIYAINLALLRLEIGEVGARPFLMNRYYFDLNHLPLAYVLIAGLAIAGVSYLLRHRSHYTRALPEWSVVLGLVVFTACLGLALSRSPINRDLQRGPFKPFYDQRMQDYPRPYLRERNQGPIL
jgi:hypothetical protein